MTGWLLILAVAICWALLSSLIATAVGFAIKTMSRTPAAPRRRSPLIELDLDGARARRRRSRGTA